MNTEPDPDSVWPGEEQIEAQWKQDEGVDFEGKAWLTPRMLRQSARLLQAWMDEPKPNDKNEPNK